MPKSREEAIELLKLFKNMGAKAYYSWEGRCIVFNRESMKGIEFTDKYYTIEKGKCTRTHLLSYSRTIGNLLNIQGNKEFKKIWSGL